MDSPESALFALLPIPFVSVLTMTLVSRFLVPLALLAAIIPSVAAGSSDCQPNEFWYDQKGCCAPKSPPSNPPSPP
jgi:hypothetical protein